MPHLGKRGASNSSLAASKGEEDPAGAPIMPGSSLGGRTLRGMLWTTSQNFGIRVLSLVTFIVLARLLSPTDYGVAGVAGVVATVMALVAAGGYSQTLVQKKELHNDDLNAVFWLSLGVSLVVVVLGICLAPVLAALFHTPQLTLAIIALTPMCLAVGLGQTHIALLQRTFRFRRLAQIAVTGNLLATAVGVTVALLGGNYWAIIVQMGIVPVWTCVGVWLSTSFRPSLSFDRTAARRLMRTSSHFLRVNLFQIVDQESDTIIVASAYGPAILGVYVIAYRVVYILLDVLTTSINIVALPAFSELQEDAVGAMSAAVRGLRLFTLTSFLGFSAAFAVAPDVVALVFGDKWAGAVGPMRILCIFAIARSLNVFGAVVSQALGKVQLVARVALVATILQIILILIAVSLHLGLDYVALALVCRAFLQLPVSLYILGLALGRGSSRRLVSVIWPTLTAAGVVIATFSILDRESVLSNVDWATLALRGALAVAVYLAVLLIAGRRHLNDLAALVSLARRRVAAPPS